MDIIDWNPIVLSLKLAVCTTLVLLAIGLPLAYWLSSRKSIFKTFVETLISLPLVLPPTVIGFYLLVLLSPKSVIGNWVAEYVGVSLLFSFTGLVIGSVIYSLPFMVRPLQSGFEKIPKSLHEASYVLGKSKAETFFRIVLPNSKSAVLTAIVLSFAHTIGEFGVVLMIGGNIPNKTKVASIALYDKVESLQYDQAHIYAVTLLMLSFVILLTVRYISTKKEFL